MDIGSILFGLFFCVVVPIAVVGYLIINVLVGPPKPAPLDHSIVLDALEHLFNRWHADGQIDDAMVQRLHGLMVLERVEATLSSEQQSPGRPLHTPPLITTALIVEQPETSMLEEPASIPTDLGLQPPTTKSARPSAAHTATAEPAINKTSTSTGFASPDASVEPPAGTAHTASDVSKPSRAERIIQALLALRTRQTLLFLGTFLIFVSALILIIFNWASFDPLLQFALLAGVCTAFWAGGAWLMRNTELARAGAGLQMVGAVLLPIVTWALSRPGLLNLELRQGWLLASVLCMPVYGLAAWYPRRVIFAGAACISLISAVLAALAGLAIVWYPVAIMVTVALFLPIERWLEDHASALVAAPHWLARAGAALALIASLLLFTHFFDYAALATALWCGAGFCLMARYFERQTIWAWPAAMLPLFALGTSLVAVNATIPWWALASALLMLVYLGLALVYEYRSGVDTLAAYTGAAILALASGVAMMGHLESIRWAAPVLIVAAIMLLLAYERGRLAWLDAQPHQALASIPLGLAAALLGLWLWALLDLTPLEPVWRALLLQGLAAVYLGLAAFWLRRVRQSYDVMLQVVALALALAAHVLAGSGPHMPADTRLHSYTLSVLSVLLMFQAQRHPHRAWAWATLTAGSLTGFAWLLMLNPPYFNRALVMLLLGFAGLYMLGSGWLRQSRWQHWSYPALSFGSGCSGLALGVTLYDLTVHAVQGWHVFALLALVLAIAAISVLWRVAVLGFIGAGVLAVAILAAYTQGFFMGWRVTLADTGMIVCAITAVMVVIGQGWRQYARNFARPYEIVGYALLTFAPISILGDAQQATFVFIVMMALYTLAIWLYRLPWMAVPAFLAFDAMLLSGAAWLLPGTRLERAALLLLGAAWLQGLAGMWSARKVLLLAAPMEQDLKAIQATDLAALITSAVALRITISSDDMLGSVCLGLAVLLALWATLHRDRLAVWGTLALIGTGAYVSHRFLSLDTAWSLAWGLIEIFGLGLVGWGIEWLTKQGRPSDLEFQENSNSGVQESVTENAADQGVASRSERSLGLGRIWEWPLSWNLVGLDAVLMMLLINETSMGRSLAALIFGLTSMTLFLATMAVRKHSLEFVYTAGATLVIAASLQLYDWGFRQPQCFVIPAGLYLLALAQGLRYAQLRHQAAQVLDSAAIVLMLGVSFGQSLRAEGLESQVYALWLCVEALFMLGYGVLAKLRVPFIAGIAFFSSAVLWLSVDPLMAINKWILLGILGLLMIAAYLLLERRQQELLQAGRTLIEAVNSWS